MRWRRVYLDGRCTDCKQPEEAHGRGGIDCPSPVSEPLSTVPFDETGARPPGEGWVPREPNKRFAATRRQGGPMKGVPRER